MPASKVSASIGPASSTALADALDHRREGPPGEPLHHLGTTGVHVHRTGIDVDGIEASLDHERKDLAADQGVATRPSLEVDQGLDRLVGGKVVGMEEGRPVVTLDHGNGPARSEQGGQTGQGLDRPGEVLEEEARPPHCAYGPCLASRAPSVFGGLATRRNRRSWSPYPWPRG